MAPIDKKKRESYFRLFGYVQRTVVNVPVGKNDSIQVNETTKVEGDKNNISRSNKKK